MTNALDDIDGIAAMLKAKSDLDDALERIAQLESSNENWEQRCESLETINADVEQQNDRLRAALIEACDLLDDLVDEVPGSVEWAERVDELRAIGNRP